MKLVDLMESWPRAVQVLIRVPLWVGIFPLLAIFEAINGVGIVLHDTGEWICGTGFNDDWLKRWWKLRKQI
jgi:hypothetical protein